MHRRRQWGHRSYAATDAGAVRAPIVRGVLGLTDGAPSVETAERLHAQLDYVRGIEAFMGADPQASIHARNVGERGAGKRGP